MAAAVRDARRHRRATSVALWLVAAGAALVTLFPIYWMFVTAITPIGNLRASDYPLWPTDVTWSGFTRPFHSFPFGGWYLNSVFIAVVGVTLTVTVNLLAGYTFAKLRFPGRDILFLLIISTLIIPVQVLMVPQFDIVLKLGWLDSNWGVIVPRAAEAFGIFLARQFFRTIPDDLLEAARLDGASEARIFLRVMLPLAKPLIAVLVIFTFMWRWNEFAWPLIILKDQASYTVTVGLLFLRGQFTTDYNALMAMTLLAIGPILVVFLAFQRFFVEGVARSGLK